MISKKLCVYSLTSVAAVFTLLVLWSCQLTTLAGAGAVSNKEATLNLAAKYEKNILQDISLDGRLLLFYQTSLATRSYAIQLRGGQGKENQPPVYDDVLRVVDRKSGRELGRVKVEFFPQTVQFIPGTSQVFYIEPASNKQKHLFKVWNFATGEAKACSDADATSFRYATVVDAQHALGAVLQKSGGESLGRLALPECSINVTESVNPSDPTSMTRNGFSRSPNNRFLAYVTSDEVIVRDAATLRMLKRIKPPPGLILGNHPTFTPDGKFLLVVASNTIFDNPKTKRYLIYYDTSSYEVARRLDITSWSPPLLEDNQSVSSPLVVTSLSVSPDSRLLAVGFTKQERKGSLIIEQAQIILYDLATGEEIARASHPPINQQHNNPFAAKVTRLAFTPDGKYLLSSTHDTFVWEVGS